MRILLLLIVLLPACSSINVAHLLSSQELIAQTTPAIPPLNVRVYKLKDHGEGPFILSQLYIAVSEYGEYPQQRFYVTDKRQNWQFVNWIKMANFEQQTPSSTFLASYILNKKLYFEHITITLEQLSIRHVK